MLNRRGFLGALGAAIAGAALDPEQLLWRPGAKLISIPKAKAELVTAGWVNTSFPQLEVGDIITIPGIYRPKGESPTTFRVTGVAQSGAIFLQPDHPTLAALRFPDSLRSQRRIGKSFVRKRVA